jgi:hypothetical protein
MRWLANPNDVDATVGFELPNQFHGSMNAPEECRRPHGPSNLCVTTMVSEKKQAVSKFDARHIFAKVNRPFHTPVSSSAEPLGNNAQPKPLNQPLTSMVIGA